MVGAKNIQFSQSEIQFLMLSEYTTRGFIMTILFAGAQRDHACLRNELSRLQVAG
jgi:hypothetical protein